MKLLIAIPTTDFLHAGFVKSLLDLMCHLNREGVKYEVKLETGTLVYLARNSLASYAVNEGFTHVLWIDSDMVFQEDIVETLQWCKKPFVCGVFQSRRPPFVSCLFSNINKSDVKRIDEYPTEPFRVAGCGFGLVLMETQVIRDVMDRVGQVNCFMPTADFGEDVGFCKRATDCGYEIWCEPNARVGHIAHIPVYEEDHRRAIKEREEMRKC